MRHDTRPRPSRRLPGGRRGAGVCAGADLGTVGGGGLGQCRVSAARRGGDCGRRGQVRPPRGAEDLTRGLEPHPRGAAGKLTCGGRGPRWFLECKCLGALPSFLVSCFTRGETEAWTVTCLAAGTRNQDSSKLSRGVPCARVLGKGLSVLTLTPSHPRGSAPFSLRPLCSSALPHPLFLSSQQGCLMVRPSLLHWGRSGREVPV